MIRVVVFGAEKGKFAYSVGGSSVEGRSRQPLLDACRQLKRMGVDPEAEIGLFRAGRSDWDLRTTVGVGAGLTVDERGPRFAQFKEFEIPKKSEAA